jgi:hypothetical protein
MKTYVCIFMIIFFRSVLLRMWNDSDEKCRENQNTFYIPLLFPENRAVYELMKKCGRATETIDDNLIQRMCIACCTNKARNK